MSGPGLSTLLALATLNDRLRALHELRTLIACIHLGEGGAAEGEPQEAPTPPLTYSPSSSHGVPHTFPPYFGVDAPKARTPTPQPTFGQELQRIEDEIQSSIAKLNQRISQWEDATVENELEQHRERDRVMNCIDRGLEILSDLADKMTSLSQVEMRVDEFIAQAVMQSHDGFQYAEIMERIEVSSLLVGSRRPSQSQGDGVAKARGSRRGTQANNTLTASLPPQGGERDPLPGPRRATTNTTTSHTEDPPPVPSPPKEEAKDNKRAKGWRVPRPPSKFLLETLGIVAGRSLMPDLATAWIEQPEQTRILLMNFTDVVKSLAHLGQGDILEYSPEGLLIAFPTPYEALQFSLSLQTELVAMLYPESLNQYNCFKPVIEDTSGCTIYSGIRVGLGIHCGCLGPAIDSITRRWEYLHADVAKARCLAEFARSGETVLSVSAYDGVKTNMPSVAVGCLATRATLQLPQMHHARPLFVEQSALSPNTTKEAFEIVQLLPMGLMGRHTLYEKHPLRVPTPVEVIPVEPPVQKSATPPPLPSSAHNLYRIGLGYDPFQAAQERTLAVAKVHNIHRFTSEDSIDIVLQLFMDALPKDEGFLVSCRRGYVVAVFRNEIAAVTWAVYVQEMFHTYPWEEGLENVLYESDPNEFVNGVRISVGIHVGICPGEVNEATGLFNFSGKVLDWAHVLCRSSRQGDIMISHVVRDKSSSLIDDANLLVQVVDGEVETEYLSYRVAPPALKVRMQYKNQLSAIHASSLTNQLESLIRGEACGNLVAHSHVAQQDVTRSDVTKVTRGNVASGDVMSSDVLSGNEFSVDITNGDVLPSGNETSSDSRSDVTITGSEEGSEEEQHDGSEVSEEEQRDDIEVSEEEQRDDREVSQEGSEEEQRDGGDNEDERDEAMYELYERDYDDIVATPPRVWGQKATEDSTEKVEVDIVCGGTSTEQMVLTPDERQREEEHMIPSMQCRSDAEVTVAGDTKENREEDVPKLPATGEPGVGPSVVLLPTEKEEGTPPVQIDSPLCIRPPSTPKPSVMLDRHRPLEINRTPQKRKPSPKIVAESLSRSRQEPSTKLDEKSERGPQDGKESTLPLLVAPKVPPTDLSSVMASVESPPAPSGKDARRIKAKPTFMVGDISSFRPGKLSALENLPEDSEAMETFRTSTMAEIRSIHVDVIRPLLSKLYEQPQFQNDPKEQYIAQVLKDHLEFDRTAVAQIARVRWRVAFLLWRSQCEKGNKNDTKDQCEILKCRRFIQHTFSARMERAKRVLRMARLTVPLIGEMKKEPEAAVHFPPIQPLPPHRFPFGPSTDPFPDRIQHPETMMESSGKHGVTVWTQKAEARRDPRRSSHIPLRDNAMGALKRLDKKLEEQRKSLSMRFPYKIQMGRGHAPTIRKTQNQTTYDILPMCSGNSMQLHTDSKSKTVEVTKKSKKKGSKE